MGQLKEVRRKQWREKGKRERALSLPRGRESLLSIGRMEGRPSGLLEPNKCGRKKVYTERESPSEVATTRGRLRGAFVLGFTEARGGGAEALAA